MDIRLSARAFRAPEPTAVFSLATSDTSLAVVTQKDLLRRYRYKTLLRAPLVVAVPPPIELSGPATSIADSRITQRREHSRLSPPPRVIGVPSPVELYGPTIVIADSRVAQRRERSRLRAPVVVGAAVVVVQVFFGPRARLARTPRIYGRATPLFVAPRVVFGPPRAFGYVAVQLVRRPQARTMWIQWGPQT